MFFKGVFVDDLDDQGNLYADLLSTAEGSTGKIEVSYLQAEDLPTTAQKIFDMNVDFVILDFRLDTNTSEGGSLTYDYKGASLGQFIRDKVVNDIYKDVNEELAVSENDTPVFGDRCDNGDIKSLGQSDLTVTKKFKDIPLILLSSEFNLSSIYKRDKTSHDLFDMFFTKSDSPENSALMSEKIYSVANAYKVINSVCNEGKDRKALFSIDGDEELIFVLSNQEIQHAIAKTDVPHLIAGFILKQIIQKTGILYSDKDIAAKLGLSLDDLDEKIISFFDDNGCRYKGVFSDGWRRWWACKTDAALENLLDARPIKLSAVERVQAINRKLDLSLQPFRSKWNGSDSEKYMFSCACCQLPTEIRHSVTVFEPKKYTFQQQRRICWDCLVNDRDIENFEISDSDKKIADAVRKGSISAKGQESEY